MFLYFCPRCCLVSLNGKENKPTEATKHETKQKETNTQRNRTKISISAPPPQTRARFTLYYTRKENGSKKRRKRAQKSKSDATGSLEMVGVWPSYQRMAEKPGRLQGLFFLNFWPWLTKSADKYFQRSRLEVVSLVARQICALVLFHGNHRENDHVYATLQVEKLAYGGGGRYPNRVAGVFE